jgi:hypothetical protein
MRFRLRTLLIVLALAPAAIGTFVALDRLNTSNCGGNNAALADVQTCAYMIQAFAEESPKGEFVVTALTAEQCRELKQVANDGWLNGGQLLVSTEPFRVDSFGSHRLLIVCDRPFTNVPRYVFGHAPPTHAAAYSDGTTALLTTREFAALDPSKLVSLNEILEQSP